MWHLLPLRTHGFPATHWGTNSLFHAVFAAPLTAAMKLLCKLRCTSERVQDHFPGAGILLE
jgi:hypothetical protein